MFHYAAFLGHQPLISIAELSATISDFSLEKILNDHIALFETKEELDQEFLDELGGTILLAECITEEALTFNDIPQVLVNEVSSMRGKITFSLRTHGVPKGVIRTLYRQCKNALRAKNTSSR